MPADLHPELEELAPLLGTWAGRCEGKYPTIQPFEYLEEVVFSHVGKPFLAYAQKTRSVADGKPLHAETGYLRVPRPGHVELVLAHPNGITEIEVGNYSVTGDRIDVELSTTAILSCMKSWAPSELYGVERFSANPRVACSKRAFLPSRSPAL